MKQAVTIGGLLLAAAMPAAALEPDVNLSGKFALSFSRFDADLAGYDYDLENNGSNLRIEAAVQEVGVRAFMAYDRGANNDGAIEAVREFFAGVETAYGTLLYGRKASDYRIAGERLDPFFNTSVAGTNGQFAAEGASYGLSNLTNGFSSNTIMYRSPSLAGLSFNLGGYISDNAEPNDKHDGAFGVSYANSDWGLDLGVQSLFITGIGVVSGAPGEATAVRAHGSYGQRAWAVGVSYEVLDVEGETEPRKHGFVSASFQVSGQLRLAAAFGTVADTDSAPSNVDGSAGTLGAFYDVTRNLSTYLAVRAVEFADVDDSTLTAAIGTKFVFDVDL